MTSIMTKTIATTMWYTDMTGIDAEMTNHLHTTHTTSNSDDTHTRNYISCKTALHNVHHVTQFRQILIILLRTVHSNPTH